MTSRRNFVIGVGSVLTGSSTFFGSGAFELGPRDRPDGWVPIGSRVPSSEGTDSSFGIYDGGTDRGGDGGDGTDGGTDDGDGTGDDDDGDSGTDGDTGDGGGAGGGRGGIGGGTGGGGRGGGGGGGRGGSGPGSGSSGENSLLLRASGPGILDSPHVRADEDGELAGLVMQNLNRRAVTYVGETSDGRFPDPRAGDRVAFKVVNDGDATVTLSVEVAGSAPEILRFPSYVDAPAVSGNQRDLATSTVENLTPGESVHVVVEVDTTEVTEGSDDAVEGVTFVGDPDPA